MSYSRTVSYNNSTFNKAQKKSLAALDASSDLDFGAALAVAESKRCAPRAFKEIHRAPSAALQMPDKAILQVDEEKLVVKKEEDLGFTIKQKAPKCPDAPKKLKPVKVIDPSFFAASATEVILPPKEIIYETPKKSQELSWRSKK